MREIKVSFQGGGAKFAQLLGAAAAIRELASPPDKRFRINAVAGASAGAIVATLLASGIDLDEFQTQVLASDLPKHIRGNAGFSFLGIDTVWFRLPLVALNLTLLPQNALRRGIEILLEVAGIPRTMKVGEFAPRLHIVRGDICQQQRLTSEDEEILDALEDSCAIPVIFRMPSRKRSFIDGGLIDNLPADELLRDDDVKGDIIAVSFKPKIRTLSSPGRYVLDAWDAIHNSRVELTKKKLGSSNVLELEDRIGTLDFRALHKDGLTSIFRESRRDSKDWLQDWDRREPVRSSAQLDVARARAQEFFEQCIVPLKRRGLATHVTVTVASHSRFDEVKQESICRSEDERPVLGARVSLGLPDGFVDQDLRVRVEAVGTTPTKIPHLLVPCGPKQFDMLVLFGRPLLRGETYRIVCTRVVSGYMDNLRAGLDDSLTVYATDDPGTVESCSITLIVPEAYLKAYEVVDRQASSHFTPAASQRVDYQGEVPAGFHAIRHESVASGTPIEGIALIYKAVDRR